MEQGFSDTHSKAVVGTVGVLKMKQSRAIKHRGKSSPGAGGRYVMMVLNRK